MTDRHHAEPATLLGFASGSLEEPFRSVLACHLEACGACRAALARLEEIGGAELERAEPAGLSDGLRLGTLARAETAAVAPVPRRPRRVLPDGLPKALAWRVTTGVDDIPWRKIAPRVGYWHAPRFSGDAGQLTFFHIGQGGRIPDHGHGGREMTFILRGSYSDRFGRFGPGDIADFDEDVEHVPVVDSDEPCICVAATEAPTRFKGMIGRIMQPLVGI